MLSLRNAVALFKNGNFENGLMLQGLVVTGCPVFFPGLYLIVGVYKTVAQQGG